MTFYEQVQACFESAYRFALNAYAGAYRPTPYMRDLAREHGYREVLQFHGETAMRYVVVPEDW